jgi:hypothetical protein
MQCTAARIGEGQVGTYELQFIGVDVDDTREELKHPALPQSPRRCTFLSRSPRGLLATFYCIPIIFYRSTTPDR